MVAAEVWGKEDGSWGSEEVWWIKIYTIETEKIMKRTRRDNVKCPECHETVDKTSFIIDSLYIGSWTAGACPLTIYECINKGCALILGMSNSSVWIIII